MPTVQEIDVSTLSVPLQKKLVDYVIDRKWYAKNNLAYRHFARKMQPLYNAYKGIFTTEEKRQWRSKLFVQMSYTTVETIKATLLQLLFKAEQWQRIKAGERTPPDKRLAMQAYMDVNLKKINAKQKYAFEVLNYVLKYGTGFTRTFWDYRTMLKTKRYPRTIGSMTIGRQTKTTREVISDYSNFRSTNPLMTYVDPKATTLDYPENCRYIIEDIPMDVNQLSMFGKKGMFYQNLDKIEFKDPQGGQSFFLDITEAPIKFATPDAEDNVETYRNRILLSDYWGKIDLPEWEGDDRPWNIAVSNERTLLRLAVPYDYTNLPFQKHVIIPEENRFYGIGVIETMLADQHFMNQLVNTRMDNVNLLLNQGWIVNDQAFRNPDEAIEVQPGFRIRTNGLVDLDRAIRQVPMQDVTGGSFQQMTDFIDRDRQKTTGATDFSSGFIPQSGINQTATGIATLTESANRRFGSMLFSAGMGMDDLLMSLMSNVQQFVTKDQILKISGREQDFKVKPHSLEGNFELESINTSVLTNEILAQLNINFLQAIQPHIQALQAEGKTIDLPMIVQEIVANFPGLSQKRNIIKSLPKPPSLPAAPGGPGGAAPAGAAPPNLAALLGGGTPA